MSLTPYFFVNDPFFNPHGRRGDRHNHNNQSSLQSLLSGVPRPAVDVHEENDRFIVEAELPGVSKENIDVHVGDNGKSVTISGKTVARRSWRSGDNADDSNRTAQPSTSDNEAMSKDPAAVARKIDGGVSQLISSERSFVGTSTFSRTIWLPRPADGSNVTAKLQDGVLTLNLPKLQDRESVRVSVM